MANVRDDLRTRRRKEFVRLLAGGTDPLAAAKCSGHPAERALETLRDLGFTLTVLEPPTEEKAA